MNIYILSSVFQQFHELAFHYVGECFVCFENSANLILTKNVYIHMLSSRGVQSNRCSPNLQKIVRNSWQQQNPWKISLNELRINKNAVLPYAIILSQEKEINKTTSQVYFKLFVKLFCRTPLRCVFRTQEKIFAGGFFDENN